MTFGDWRVAEGRRKLIISLSAEDDMDRETIEKARSSLTAGLADLEAPDPALPLVVATQTSPSTLHAGTLMGATAAWLGLVFGLCYVVFPAALAAVGLSTGVLRGLWFNLPAFALASFVVAVGAGAARSEVRHRAAAADPTFAATAGGLFVWCIGHNTAPALIPFAAMPPLELAAFVATNLLEMALLGAMLASFARSRAVAFAMGASFQALVLGLALGIAGLLS